MFALINLFQTYPKAVEGEYKTKILQYYNISKFLFNYKIIINDN